MSPEDRSDCGCTRRQLLAAAGAVAGAVAATGLADVALPRMAFAADAASRADLLVVVSLRGGADGLSLVPPLADPGYVSARPGIAVRPDQAIRLDRAFGLHPGLSSLMPFWHTNRLAVVQAVGDSDGTRSHFEATDAMERGVNVGNRTTTGWIDRYLTARGLRVGDFPALAIGTQAPVALRGPAPELAVTDVQKLQVHVPAARRAAAEQALRRLYAGVSGPHADAARCTLTALARLAPVQGAPYRPRPGITYPGDPLGRALRQVAQVARAGVGLQVACVEGYGWDMHEGMGGAGSGFAHDVITRLGDALASFARDLGPLLATTTVVTMSEFGRRVAQNGSGGVDHGHGSAMLVLGGGIRGGRVYGRWPGLGSHQLEDGDLRVTTDYRDVLGELVRRRLDGRGLTTVFPDHRPREIGLARPR